MASNYGELKTDVQEALGNRSDLVTRIPKFIAGAMARVSNELAAEGGIVDQEQTAYASTVIGQDSLAVPADFQLLRYIKIGDDPLEEMSYDELIGAYGDANGTPETYAIFDGSFFFRPVPNSVAQVRIGYIKRYPALSADADTNWLFTNGGNLLLYAACMEAAPYLRDDPRVTLWGAQYKEAMNLVLRADERSRRGAKPAGVALDPMFTGVRSSWLYG